MATIQKLLIGSRSASIGLYSRSYPEPDVPVVPYCQTIAPVVFTSMTRWLPYSVIACCCWRDAQRPMARADHAAR